MLLFDYACPRCGRGFEAYIHTDTERVVCPCGADAERQLGGRPMRGGGYQDCTPGSTDVNYCAHVVGELSLPRRDGGVVTGKVGYVHSVETPRAKA